MDSGDFGGGGGGGCAGGEMDQSFFLERRELAIGQH
jgi:hypothetical protein